MSLARSFCKLDQRDQTEDFAKPLAKSREVLNHHINSTIWNDFALRPDDIVIATYMKTGTTWMQQIVSQLLTDGAACASPAALSPWLDYRIHDRAAILAAMEAQSGRRYIKTHLPADALVYSPSVKYIYVARDGRDVLWSIFHHYTSITDATFYALNETPGRVGPPFPRIEKPVREYFLDWLELDGYPFWSFWDHIRSWWMRRHLPNVLLVHHASLTRDLRHEVERVAAHLDVHVDPRRWDNIFAHCSIEFMRANATRVVPRGGKAFVGGASTFLANGGVNQRWHDVLTAKDCDRYESRALRELGPECAAWLAQAVSRRP